MTEVAGDVSCALQANFRIGFIKKIQQDAKMYENFIIPYIYIYI
jgi:hypothetical protein